VAPLVVTGATQTLVGTCTLITNGAKTIAFSSAEVLRAAGEPLAIALTLDGKRLLRVASWSMGRAPGMGIVELAEPFPKGEVLDVEPLPIAGVCATVDTRGAPSAILTVVASGAGYKRHLIPVHVDAIDGGGMSDEVITRLASPDEPRDVGADADGGALFTWMPPDPVLGRKSEVVAVALALVYRSQTFKPRPLPPLAELVGLEDLGRALPWGAPTRAPTSELGQVAGEIRDDETGPLAGLDLDE
jgi:hypothetical protein